MNDATTLWAIEAVSQCHKNKILPSISLQPLFHIDPSQTIKINEIKSFDQAGGGNITRADTDNLGFAACLNGGVSDGKNLLVIAFRGTDPSNFKNWLRNAQGTFFSDGTQGVTYHRGFLEMTKNLMMPDKGNGIAAVNEVAAKCGNEQHVRVIGHSMGGALAVNLMSMALDNTGTQPEFDNFIFRKAEEKAKIKSLALQGFEPASTITNATVAKYNQNLQTWWGQAVPCHIVKEPWDTLVSNTCPHPLCAYDHPTPAVTPTPRTGILFSNPLEVFSNMHNWILGQNTSAISHLATISIWRNKTYDWWKSCNDLEHETRAGPEDHTDSEANTLDVPQEAIKKGGGDNIVDEVIANSLHQMKNLIENDMKMHVA